MKYLTIFILSLLAHQQIMAQTTYENELIKEINYCRENPKSYAELVRGYVSKRHIYMNYAGLDIINILDTMESLQPLKYNQEIYASLDSFRTEHDDLLKRLLKSYKVAENICYASKHNKQVKTARELTIELLLDYGVPGYRHRVNILSDKYNQIAVKQFWQGSELIIIQNFTN